MFGLEPDREIRRDRQSRRLCLAGSDAARPRHHGGLRPTQERERERACFGKAGRREAGRYAVRPTLSHAALTMDADPALNPALDQKAIAAAFARDRRVHTLDILTENSAARLRRCLEQETEFSIVTRKDDG